MIDFVKLPQVLILISKHGNDFDLGRECRNLVLESNGAINSDFIKQYGNDQDLGKAIRSAKIEEKNGKS
jgi:hypothetical protein